MLIIRQGYFYIFLVKHVTNNWVGVRVDAYSR